MRQQKLRIVVHGQQEFGHAVLQRLLKNNENVVAVCVAPSKANKPIDPLKELALKKSLPVYQPHSWKTPESLALMKSFDADVCMMAYVLLYVPKAVLDAPKLGSFQYHPSLLPMHRGPCAIHWAIATGATKTGLSVFWPDEGFDEGPILMQKTCPIDPDETLGDVYFNKLLPMGVDAMIESIELVRQGNGPKTKQNLEQGSYESWFSRKETYLNWNESSQDVYNIIRAANPKPGSWTMYRDMELTILDAELYDGKGNVGEVVCIDNNGIVVATGCGAIRIKRVRVDAEKISAIEYARRSSLAVDDILGR